MIPGTPALRTVIVDDESLARSYLKELLCGHPEIGIIAECADGNEAVKVIDDLDPDLVFLDIQMPGLNGFEVLDLIESRPAVVFVTAFDQYALKAFDAHAIDYLLKPFSRSRLDDALKKVMASSGNVAVQAPALRERLRPASGSLRRIVVKDGTRICVIADTDIDYVTAQDDYVAIFSKGTSVLKNQTIASLEESLDPQRFVRIHRSAIINIEKLNRLELMSREKYVAIMEDRTELPVSRAGYKRHSRKLTFSAQGRLR